MTEQYLCQSYAEDGKIVNCTCGKCEWREPSSPEYSLREHIDDALKRTADYLYVIDDSKVDGITTSELFQAISTLRQLINEEYVGKHKTVSSQLIYDILKPGLLTHSLQERINELKLMQGGDEDFQAYSEDRIKQLESEKGKL